MTAIEELHDIIKIDDKFERTVALHAWCDRWVKIQIIDRRITTDALQKMTPDESSNFQQNDLHILVAKLGVLLYKSNDLQEERTFETLNGMRVERRSLMVAVIAQTPNAARQEDEETPPGGLTGKPV